MHKLAITILLVAAGALPALADDDTATISVTGTATVDIVPDELVWNLEIRNEGPDLSGVVDVHQGRVAEALAFLKRAGIDEDHMSPSRMSCGENWVHNRGERRMEGYQATTRVGFRSTDLDAYVDLWTGLAAIEGVGVTSVGYDHSERIKYRDETRREALRAARAKAADLAAVLGAEIGEPLRIVENPGRNVMAMASNSRIMADGNAGAAASTPGRIQISMSIDVVFKLVTGE